MTDPIFDGVKLMFIGMGTVVVFLLVMIGCMSLYTRLIAPFATILDPKVPEKPAPKPANNPVESDTMHAIAAAVLCAAKSGRKINSATCAGRNCKVEVVSQDEVKIDGISFGIDMPSGAEKKEPPTAKPITAGIQTVEAPIPGTVMRINVRPGDRVEKGMELLMIEAMKMETPIQAGMSGRIVEILVNGKEVVTAGQPLMTLESL